VDLPPSVAYASNPLALSESRGMRDCGCFRRFCIQLFMAWKTGSRHTGSIVKPKRQPEGQLQKIIGFHQDEEFHWVADLECGHTQHVRHNPPWTVRHWVTTADGRRAHIRHELRCLACDAPTKAEDN